MNGNDFNLEKWVEIIKKHYAIMSGFHPETYEITLGDIEATARFFYDLGLKRAMEEKPTVEAVKIVQKTNQSEWGEEDESMYTRTIGILGKCYMGQLPTKVEEELNWLKYRLKYLIPQNQWKPSDEQIRTLEYYMHALIATEHKEVLFGLYEQLKKLTE